MITDDVSEKLSFFSRQQNLSAFILFICLAAYALNANPFSDETVAPFDRLLQFPGWSTIQSRQAVHEERSDILDSQLPTWITLKDQIRRGESPLWYPNGAGGQPISLEICNPAFLLFVAVKDNALSYYLVGLAKLVISGFGVYLLLRTFLRWLPSVWGGIVFMLCGFNAAWFFWEHVTTAMWIPWLFWSTVHYLKDEDKKWLPVITIISLFLIFGGFPPVAAFGFYSFALLIVFWNIYDVFSNKPNQTHSNFSSLKMILIKIALPLVAVGIAFLMSAVTLIPFRDTMSGINLSYRTGGGTHFSISDLRLFFSSEDPPQVERTAYSGILVLLCSLLGFFSAFRTTDEKLRKFILFSVLLVVVSTCIAFGILPHGLIMAIPVFNSNPWGRLVVIALLGLSILSSIGLDFFMINLQASLGRYLRLTPPNSRRIVIVILIAITVLQFYSQKKLFNNFNAVVPSAWFYPLTPSIKYVKERLQPLQSVIADASAYWFAGTLGAYGIPEWYAHSFRTDKEKEVLGELAHNRSKSPTSMVIIGQSINYNSSLMDKLAIKYLLVHKNVENKRTLELQELTHDPAPPLPYNSWKQHIYISRDIVAAAIGFSFMTFGEKYAPADIRLTLFRENGGGLIAEAELPKNEITETEWGFIYLPNTVYLSKGGYYLQLSLPGYTGPGSLTALATKTRGNTDNFLEVNGVKTDLSLLWKIGYFEDMYQALSKWNIFTLENDIVIYENRRVTNSAYFIENLDASNDRIDFTGLAVRQVSADRFDIDYSKGDRGWVVLPMHSNPGWKAYMNDRQVTYGTYLDILPAIPVNGPGHIIFKYQPGSFRKGLMASLAGIVIFLVFSGICIRKDK